MGGKKKNLANRLAKMSDEERVRYMQRKADIEEEAKKRKEQLISTFLKNKIKKEDGFSRLNLAKINQQWHQILRFNKCKEMKEDVEHMKNYIDRVLEYKNRTIEKLLEELEMAEEQYGHNFQSHMTHIDTITASHNENLGVMTQQFHQDLEEILLEGRREREEMGKSAESDRIYLKTIIFGQNKQAELVQRETKEKYLKKQEEVTSSFRIRFEAFIKRCESAASALWREVAQVVGGYVARTDARRLHLAELRRIDAESAAEIASNQERISRQQEEVERLAGDFEELRERQEEAIKKLERQLETDTRDFFAARRVFRKAVEVDERLLVALTGSSRRAVEDLGRLVKRGEQIVNLGESCRKLETEKEHLTKWLVEVPVQEVEELRLEKIEPEENVKKIVISAKSVSPPSEGGEQVGVLKEFERLMDMERFWGAFSRVDLDNRLFKKEKKLLEEQNKEIRGMLRAVLEAAVLVKSESGRVSTMRVGSKRGARSAPLKRILI